MQGFEMNQLYLITTVLFSLILRANAFSYKDAENWGKKYPECNGKNQSPVIIREDVGNNYYPSSANDTMKLTNFKKLPKKLTIKNTGHTVEIKAEWSGKPPMCTGGPLHGNYVFEKVVFHWTQTRSKNHNPDHRLDSLEINLHKVRSPNSSAEIPPFRLTSYFGEDYSLLIYYPGSLDYPPCSESVSWFLDLGQYFATENLINEFRKIKLAEGDVSNVRPTQPLNKRKVWTVNTE